MSPAQLAALLELLPGPARIYDASGAVVAQNERARGKGDRDEDWTNSAVRELGEGLQVRLWVAERRAPDIRTRHGEDEDAKDAEDAAHSSLVTRHSSLETSALANSMAHAIRNPISAIVTAAGLVRDDPGIGEETALLLEVITKESHQLNRILTDFTAYVRPRPFQADAFDLAFAARQTMQELRRDKVLPPSTEVEDALPDVLPAWGDEAQVRQALWNIVRNAGQALPQGGLLRLSGAATEDMATLCVTDSGRGFSSEDLKRALEPFYSNTPEGAGLGLPIARAAIERCGGRLWLENLTEENAAPDAAPDAAPRLKAQVCLELPLPPLPTGNATP